MCLVDHEMADQPATDPLEHTRIPERFRITEEKIDLSGGESSEYLRPRGAFLAAFELRDGEPGVTDSSFLIRHQAHQRIDDERNSVKKRRRQ